MELISMVLVSLLCAFLVPISKFMVKKTKIEWEDNNYLDYSKIILMVILMSMMLCVSIYTSRNLWFGFFVGVGLGFFWRNTHSPFLGAALGTLFFFNPIFYLGLTLLVIIMVTYGPRFKHIDFLFFLSMAVLFSYINFISAVLSIFNLAATGGGIAGIMINGVGVIWKKRQGKKKKRKQ